MTRSCQGCAQQFLCETRETWLQLARSCLMNSQGIHISSALGVRSQLRWWSPGWQGSQDIGWRRLLWLPFGWGHWSWLGWLWLGPYCWGNQNFLEQLWLCVTLLGRLEFALCYWTKLWHLRLSEMAVTFSYVANQGFLGAAEPYCTKKSLSLSMASSPKTTRLSSQGRVQGGQKKWEGIGSCRELKGRQSLTPWKNWGSELGGIKAGMDS